MPIIEFRTDAIAHDLAGDLHGLLVEVRVGVLQVGDGRFVDERAVGQLLRVDQVIGPCDLAVVRLAGGSGGAPRLLLIRPCDSSRSGLSRGREHGGREHRENRREQASCEADERSSS